MSAQLDLLSVEPIRNVPRVVLKTPEQAAMEALQQSGCYIDAKGNLVLAKPAEWRRAVPDRPGYWLATRGGGQVSLHQFLALPGGFHLTGMHPPSDSLAVANYTKWLVALECDWFGPILTPPAREARELQEVRPSVRSYKQAIRILKGE